MHRIIDVRNWLAEQTTKVSRITFVTRRPRRGRYRVA